jgi:hypothetical protein
MFNRNRIIGAAIGLTAFGVSGLSAQEIAPHAGDATKEGQRPVVIDNPKGQTETNERAREGGTKTGNFCGASFALHCQPNAVTADKYEDARNGREERDIIAQESVADSTASILWWTRMQLLLSGLGILGLGWTLYESRRAANAGIDGTKAAWETLRETKKIGVAQTRAFLNCVGGDFKFTDRSIEFHLDIENLGNTPSRSVKINAAMSVVLMDFRDEKATPEKIVLNPCETFFGVIPARGSQKIYIVWTRGFGSVEDFDRMVSVGKGFTLDLLLEWEDVFGERQNAVFFIREDGGDWFKEGQESSIRIGRLATYCQSTREGKYPR